MTVPGLDRFDDLTAVGILSRMALAIESDGRNPASVPILDGEEQIRRVLRDYASADGDVSTESLLDWLDRAVEQVAPPVDEASAIERLAESAAIWSDAYQIEFSRDSFVEAGDQELAVETVHSPHYQEDFGPDFNPALISLFARWFHAGTSSEFLCVTAGKRSGLIFNVVACWRMYPELLHIRPHRSIIGALRKFAGRYGIEFKFGNFSGLFLESEVVGDSRRVNFQITARKDSLANVYASVLAKYDEHSEELHASFGMAVDVAMYRKDVARYERRRLKSMARIPAEQEYVGMGDILEDFDGH